MNNAEIRRTLGSGMPTGENNLADMSFSVRRVEPVEEEPSTVPMVEYLSYASLMDWSDGMIAQSHHISEAQAMKEAMQTGYLVSVLKYRDL